MSAEEINQRWRGVTRCFPLWRFPVDLFFDPTAWGLIGADLTTMMVRSKHTRRAAAALEGAHPEQIDALARIAEVNSARAQDVFRTIFFGYVSIPIALAAMLTDAAPDALRAAIQDNANGFVMLLVGALLLPIIYFCGLWRAKQIAWTIDLYRAGALTPLPPKART